MLNPTIGQFIKSTKLIDEYSEKIAGIESATELTLAQPELCKELLSVYFEDIDNLDNDTALGALVMILEMDMPVGVPLASFEYKGVMYHAPDNAKEPNPNDPFKPNEIPLGKMKFGDGIEAMAMQGLSDGKVTFIPYVLACVFKTKDEWDNQVKVDITERALLFMDLPLDDALNSYFFLTTLYAGLANRIKDYLQTTSPSKTKRKTGKQGRKSSQSGSGTVSLEKPAKKLRKTKKSTK